ncbi:histone-like nucleoid-structuring protein Lsr2 [Streptomyces sp. BI20]|uniref:histone-like nucleoid-structuring protein Lsr2 n=1 Tax=Streptomyces sp. BI20 TaxID=3403460 RepID=UPI003C714847
MKIVYVDDFDGSTTDDAAKVELVSFGIDGKEYEADLMDTNAAVLRELLAPYIKAGRKVGGRAVRRASAVAEFDARVVRKWANENGYELSGYGRLPYEVTEAYRVATQR